MSTDGYDMFMKLAGEYTYKDGRPITRNDVKTYCFGVVYSNAQPGQSIEERCREILEFTFVRKNLN